MKKWFDPDSKLFTAIGILADHCLLSILWLVCSLPVVTVGAASAAVCSVSFRILNEDECRLLKDFFLAFRKHFLLSTKLWLSVLVIGLVFAADVYFYLQAAVLGTSWSGVAFGMITLIALLLGICLTWLCPYLTQYACGFLQAVKMSFLLGLVHLGHSMLMLAADAALIFLSIFISFLIPFLPGLITLINTLCIRLVFRKYTKPDSAQPES